MYSGIKNLKYILFSVLLVLSLMLGVFSPAQAQFNAFKDPTVNNVKAKVADTDFVAVEREIQGGKVMIGETAHFVVIFKNRQATPVKVHNIQLYPSSNVDTVIALNQCSLIPLTQDAQCAVTVSVTGKQAGAWRVEMLVEHDGQSRITTATISGNIEGAENKDKKTDIRDFYMSPDELDFGNFTGGIPLSRAVSLKNNSAEDIAIKSIFLNVSEKSGFSYESLCPSVLKKDASCNIIVTWAPNLKSRARGVLTIEHSGKSGSSSIEFKGEYSPEEQKFEDVEEGNIEFSSNILDFGSSDGSITRTKSITLSNKTLSDISITGVRLEAVDKTGFSYNSKCPAVLKSGGNCVIVVRWQPTTPGLSQGVFTVNHTGKTSMANFEITGNYIPPKAQDVAEEVVTGLKLSQDEVDFGTTSDDLEKIFPVTITNKTLKTVKLFDMSVKASSQSGISYETECFSSLKPNESCSVMIKWKPTSQGLSQGAFVLFHSGVNGSEVVRVKGNYEQKTTEEIELRRVLISPSELDFGTATESVSMSKSYQCLSL